MHALLDSEINKNTQIGIDEWEPRHQHCYADGIKNLGALVLSRAATAGQ
jgi:hypothetical protein